MDNKKSYSKPFMMVEVFVAQEYCMGCSIPRDHVFSLPFSYSIRLESNGIQDLQTNGNSQDNLVWGAIKIYWNGNCTKSNNKYAGSYYKYSLDQGSFIILDSTDKDITNTIAGDKTFFYCSATNLSVSNAEKNSSG